jgi:hypothetical protein
MLKSRIAAEKSVHTVTWTIWASAETLVIENVVLTPPVGLL